MLEETDMFDLHKEHHLDVFAREALLDDVFGPARFAKASERLREGRLPAERLSFVAKERGRLVGTVRLWNVTAGPHRPALLLGPLAVARDAQGRGIGGALMRHALKAAGEAGHRAVLLVGDAPYYARFGFCADKTAALAMPAPYDPVRLLAHELKAGALDGACGLITATGRLRARRMPAPLRAMRLPTGLPRAA